MPVNKYEGTEPAMTTSELSTQLSIPVSFERLTSLGFRPIANVGNAKYWKVTDINKIITALQTKLEEARLP